MDEIRRITEKYDKAFVEEQLTSLEGLNSFALTFYKDVAEIYDCITRIRNLERNPTGFSLGRSYPRPARACRDFAGMIADIAFVVHGSASPRQV